MRIKYSIMTDTFKEKLMNYGTDEELAEQVSVILTDNTCDGIVSHGVNRFSRIIEYINKGYIKVNNRPEEISSHGAIKIINGNLGLGVTNAWYSMGEAIELAKEYGIGCVGLRNTNHWMRGATYGIQAAAEGMVGICFTNTMPNMPAWGAKDNRIGNNPLVISVPNNNSPVVLDMAMSQFSYGRMENCILNDEKLPLSGGYNKDDVLTADPSEILSGGRILPTGFWKGSGLSVVLDLLTTIITGGNSTKELGGLEREYSVSQTFIAINPAIINDADAIEKKVKTTIEYIKKSKPVDSETEIFYPGEQSSKRRKDNLDKGILVNDKVWEQILRI